MLLSSKSTHVILAVFANTHLSRSVCQNNTVQIKYTYTLSDIPQKIKHADDHN